MDFETACYVIAGISILGLVIFIAAFMADEQIDAFFRRLDGED